MSLKSKTKMREIRHKRIRKRISGTPERPRMAVYKSIKHISVQIIDDVNGVTLAAASTLEKGLDAKGNQDGAKKVGEAAAKRAQEKGVKSIIFDRGGNRFHGCVARVAEGARAAGLEF
jgi:large subunit ribosomal protein L18